MLARAGLSQNAREIHASQSRASVQYLSGGNIYMLGKCLQVGQCANAPKTKGLMQIVGALNKRRSRYPRR